MFDRKVNKEDADVTLLVICFYSNFGRAELLCTLIQQRRSDTQMLYNLLVGMKLVCRVIKHMF